MNDYFEYLDMDSEFIPAFPSNNMYKNTVMTNMYPSKLQDIMNLQDNTNKNDKLQTNMNTQTCGLSEFNEGFLRGNMFPTLYDPYKKENITNIMPESEKQRKLMEIQKYGFAMKDINLYLDLYPDNSCMINLYNRYLKQYNDLLKKYEMQYGPITLDSTSLDDTPWAWNKTKWPWEGGN